MNRKNVFSILLCCMLVVSCSTQVRLIYKSNQVNNEAQDTLKIKRVGIDFRTGIVKVKLKDGSKIFFPPDSVWGVNYNERVNYRIFMGGFYYVRQLDSINIYSQHHSGGKSGHTHYYFSRTRDSELYTLTRRNLNTTYSNDTCFINTLNTELKWFQSAASYDGKKKSYRVVELYKKCHPEKQLRSLNSTP